MKNQTKEKLLTDTLTRFRAFAIVVGESGLKSTDEKRPTNPDPHP